MLFRGGDALKITNVGYHFRHSPGFCINRPNGSGDYILLVIRTEAFLTINGNRLYVCPNSAVIFKKGTPQLYGSLGGEYINDWIHFMLDEKEEQAITSLGIPFDTPIPMHENTQLSDFIKSMIYEYYSDNIHKDESTKRYFDLILLKLSEIVAEVENKREHPYYDLFCSLRHDIHLSPQNDWNIDGISQKMHLNRSYVQHLYHSFFGTNITSDVRACRIGHAKYLLSSTNMTVTAVSEACGYQNDVHFMRLFKKSVGMTPSQFRKTFELSQNEVEKSKSKPPYRPTP